MTQIHKALAREYRPRRFDDLVAQEHVADGLRGAVAKNRVAPGYLLTGPRGTGKTSAARILAMALNCAEPKPAPGEPCGECSTCERIRSGGANLDVVEIDAASHRGVDDARELRERASYAASTPDGYKVYIVDEAHMLTREAWNALLKILEEPPPRVVFVFATTEPQKIASTTTAVLSRLQRFDFRSIGPADIKKRLEEVADKENIKIEEDALVLIGRVANGGMRDALSLLDQVLVFDEGTVTASGVRQALGLIDDELYADLLRIIADRDSAAVFPFVAGIVDQGADLGEFVNGLAEVMRGLMLALLDAAPTGLTEALREAIVSAAPRFAKGDVLRMLALLGEAEANIRRSPNARLHVETLLLHWTLLDRTVDLADILRSLDKGSGGSRGTSQARGGGTGGPALLEDAKAPEKPRSRPAVLKGDPVAHLQASWDTVVAAVAARARILEEAIRETRVVGLVDEVLELEVRGGGGHLEGLERKRSIIEEAVSDVLGRATRVALRGEDPGLRGSEGAGSARRQTVDDDRAARMQAYRAQDPALNDMVEALDLELTE